MQLYKPNLNQNQSIYLNTESDKSTMNYQNKGINFLIRHNLKLDIIPFTKKLIKTQKRPDLFQMIDLLKERLY